MFARRRSAGDGNHGVGHGGGPITDQGFALIAVVVSLAVLTLFLLTALAYTLNSMPAARRDQDAKAAEQAAVAGVQEYLSRLLADDNYWQEGNTDTTNAAFTSAGQPIQGTGGSSSTAARYTYKLLSSVSDTSSSGTILLRVTGMSGRSGSTGTVTRTLTAEFRRSGLLDYVYLTNYEVTDPDLNGSSSNCARYHYALDSQPARATSDGCSEIQWTALDTVNGPLHSNDALQINGSVNFTDAKTETSWPATNGAAAGSKTWWGTQSPPLTGNSPTYAASISLPESNSELLTHVAPNIDADGSVGKGCQYTGATRIRLTGSTMKVLSPSTTSSTVPSRCYNTSTPNVEQTVDIPPVIYVGSTSSSCVFGAIGYPVTNELYTNSGSDASAWQSTVSFVYQGKTYSGTYRTTNYACARGTAYVQGTTSTPVTIAGADDVLVTGDLTVDSTSGATAVGLIAGNCVWVYHPVRTTAYYPSNLNSTTSVSTIQAAILSLRHSFVVQNWNGGSALGTLTVYGAIAQKFRGPVGTGYSDGTIASGYAKAYTYDTRLSYLQPPYFLKATDAPYEVYNLTDG